MKVDYSDALTRDYRYIVAAEDEATSCNTSILFSCAILLLCMWPLLQFYSVHTQHEMDDILKVKNACKSVQSLIHLWMYVINFFTTMKRYSYVQSHYQWHLAS